MKQTDLPRFKFNSKVFKTHLRITDKELDYNTRLHWHNYFELEIILNGSGIHNLNGSQYQIQKGTALILTPIDFHSVYPNDTLSILHLSFDDNMLSEKYLIQLSSSQTKSHIQLDEQTVHQLCMLAELLKSENQLDDGGCTKELFESFICILLRKLKIENDSSINNMTGMKKSFLYLINHFRENPSLEEIASLAGFNPHYFSELFKKTTGVNYSAYLNQLRISYAKNLLLNGFSVTETCYQSGFGSPSNFLSAFKKATGTTPKEFKKNNSKN